VENNLKSLFYIYASLNILTVEEKSEYLVEFYNLDKNKDGKIDFDELVEGMQNSFEVDQETAI
jgi:Ca2+-binding EF-hand superfamily protein